MRDGQVLALLLLLLLVAVGVGAMIVGIVVDRRERGRLRRERAAWRRSASPKQESPDAG